MSEQTDKPAREVLGGGVTPKTTRERILFAALELFYEHGFHAVGVDRIIARVGVTKTTFYNHFESKDDLAVEAIRMRNDWENRTFMEALQKKAGFDPKAMLLAAFDVIDDWFSHPDYNGCIFINACAEFPSAHDPIHQAAAAHYAGVLKTFTEMAKAAGIRDAEAFAREWIMLAQGAFTYRMVMNDNTAARDAKRIAVATLERRLAENRDAGKAP